MDVDDENKVDKNETNDKPKAKENGASSGKSLNLLKKQWHHVPVIVVGLVGIAILVAAVLGLSMSFDTTNETPQDTVTLESTYPENTDFDQTYAQRADQMFAAGNYDEAQRVLDQGIEQAGQNNTAKYEFYLLKAQIAFNFREFEDSLVFAKAADELNGTSLSAVLVAESAELVGDNLTALDYYTLAANRMPESQRDLESTSSAYAALIKNIERLGGVYVEE